MRLECCTFAGFCVAAVVATEAEISQSIQGRGVRGSYVDGEIDAVSHDVINEDETFWNRLMQETEMSAVVPTVAPPTRVPPTETPPTPPRPTLVPPTPVPPTPPPPTTPPTPAPFQPSPRPPVVPTVAPPSPTPTTNVIDVILPVAKFGGDEFLDPDSYQSQALSWLEGNANVGSYSDEQIIQRYALATIYFSTYAVATPATDAFLGAGETPAGWNNTAGWLSDADECTWFGIGCADGSVESIQLVSCVVVCDSTSRVCHFKRNSCAFPNWIG